MSPIQLPRPLEDYFAFAELPPGRLGRRFTITFPYFDGERLDRLQWWWRISATQERIGGEAALRTLRDEAVQRFRTHIERWLTNSDRALTDGDPFPRLLVPTAVGVEEEQTAPPDNLIAWPADRVANG
jgi:hypothetical protein